MAREMNNKLVRDEAKALNLPLWKVANIIGVSDNTLYRRMRYELPIEEQKAIVAKIREYQEGKL